MPKKSLEIAKPSPNDSLSNQGMVTQFKDDHQVLLTKLQKQDEELQAIRDMVQLIHTFIVCAIGIAGLAIVYFIAVLFVGF